MQYYATTALSFSAFFRMLNVPTKTISKDSKMRNMRKLPPNRLFVLVEDVHWGSIPQK